MVYGLSAGALLGLYDFWTKKAMNGNSVIPIVFWSSLFGAIAWLPAFLPVSDSLGFYVDWTQTNVHQQALILVKGLAMTFSWVFAYYSVRELPMSFSGAVRASGPLWTFAGGALIFGEYLSPLQFSAVLASILAYYALSLVGKKEGLRILRNWPVLMMLAATVLSAMTTVYDKFLVQTLGLPVYSIQAYSAFHRCALAMLVFLALSWKQRRIMRLRWSVYVPLVGLSWVGAELIYFFAIADPVSNVTYLSIFRRVSLVVGFFLSVLLIGERNVLPKSAIIGLIMISTAVLILQE
ncbi:DMT family transporter [Pannonibacter sp. SL95]|uniref:DMT family transporter n=1 Tax=Pannonibacter sp. SL95 TaxID=2995153 RepID=UPI0022747023|nr:DMT family transporter [Pannonibacter sp. SL95]MCY1707767.1 DMT family transporter [Pannonibacter sp. SL95]